MYHKNWYLQNWLKKSTFPSEFQNLTNMVCVANEVKVECVVQDGSAAEKTVSSTFTVPASTTVDQLYKRVAETRKCEPDSFQLMHNENMLMKGEDSGETTLIELDPNCLNQTAPIVINIQDFPAKPSYSPPRAGRTIVEEDDEISFFDGSKSKSCKPVTSCRTVDFCSSPPEKRYVGLVNQAMTCYLNSLLQALYMTPEFRNALYSWEYNAEGSDKDQTSSIPYQLQKLFLNLQTSTKLAVETTSLTKSFGWDSSEAWQQHDIQELCRVMFDALETKFKNTEHSNLINRLYEGKMTDYVKCLECKTEKTREDTFLDIPLPVRPFDSITAYGSVEEALTAFVKYETLDGNNQYHCEKCNKKCDAHKGLKFAKFPYILTLHLKRFDFDYKTLIRMKLNDRVTFPYRLNLNSFIENPLSQESPCLEEDAGMSVKFDDTSTTDSGTLEDDCPPCNGVGSVNNHSNNHDQENDEGIDMSNGISATNGITQSHETEKNREECSDKDGPYLYELFAIMIHNGGASGGHYYAYILDFTINEWLCFNDTTVSPITESHIERVYGGGPTKAYSSSTNAYMLMYRQIDPSKNDVPMQEEDFPEHIKTLLKKMKESEDDDKRYDDRSRFCRVKVWCNHPKARKLMTKQIHAGKNSTLAELKEKAYEKFSLYGDVDLDQCRLVFYDSYNNMIKHSYEGEESNYISEIFKNFTDQPEFLLEIRRKDQQFETYKPNGIPMQVYVIDVINEDLIDGPFNVRGYNLQSGIEFKEQLSKIVNIDPRKMNVYLKINPGNRYHIFDDEKKLDSESFNLEYLNKVFVTTPCDPIQEESTPLNILDLIKNFQRVMWLHIQLPNADKDYTEELKSLALESKDEPMNNESVDFEARNSGFQLIQSGIPKTFHRNSVVREDIVLNDGEKTLSTMVDDNSNSHKNRTDLFHDNRYPHNRHTDEESNYYSGDVPDSSKNLNKDKEAFAHENCFSKDKKLLDDAVSKCLESASEDSSLSDSEKTLVDSSDSYKTKLSSYYDHFLPNYRHTDEESNYYFKSCLDSSEGNKSLLKVFADNRMSVEVLKKKLERIVGVSIDSFNICTQHSDASEMEVVDLKNNLDSYNDGQRFFIVLGRALRKGDLKLKLYVLWQKFPERPYKFMFDLFFSEDMTVAQAKEEIVTELKRKDEDISLERLRLRKKTLNFPSKVLFNNLTFKDNGVSSEDEILIQQLEADETVTTPEQIPLFVRLWIRSTLELLPCVEIVLKEKTDSELIEKIKTVFCIPEGCLEVMRGKGSFPCENTSFLNLDSDLDWKMIDKDTDSCSIKLDHGCVILCRDSKTPLKKLNQEEKIEFTKKEKKRLNALGTPSCYYNHRREKPLKIYLDSD